MIRVLIIDDSDDDYELAVHALRRVGFEVHARRVERLGELQDALEAPRWDVCILDWVMPEMTTPEVMRALSSSAHAKTPCIVWSGRDDPKVAFIAKEVLGAAAFLHKGQMEQLPPLVIQILGRPPKSPGIQ